MRTFNWGILGTGNIAGSMAADLSLVPGANLQAVASRNLAKANAFATRWQAASAHGSYDALFADPKVDIIYIATPNACHKDNILAALAAGKHVLCEKPLTLSPEEGKTCAKVARDAKLFLMEAMWSAFFPAMNKARDLVQSGAIGTPRHLTANFVSFRDVTEHPNLFDPNLGGGASLDLGIYPLAAALILAGPIADASAQLVYGESGVDEMAALSLVHENGVISLLSFGFRVEMPIAITLVGDLGRIVIPQDFHMPDQVILETNRKTEAYDFPKTGLGYAHEAAAVQEAIDQGKLESDIWPLANTLACAEILATAGGT